MTGRQHAWWVIFVAILPSFGCQTFNGWLGHSIHNALHNEWDRVTGILSKQTWCLNTYRIPMVDQILSHHPSKQDGIILMSLFVFLGCQSRILPQYLCILSPQRDLQGNHMMKYKYIRAGVKSHKDSSDDDIINHVSITTSTYPCVC